MKTTIDDRIGGGVYFVQYEYITGSGARTVHGSFNRLQAEFCVNRYIIRYKLKDVVSVRVVMLFKMGVKEKAEQYAPPAPR